VSIVYRVRSIEIANEYLQLQMIISTARDIKVSRDYLDELDLNSIYTKDRRNGIASLSVYDYLHCLVNDVSDTRETVFETDKQVEKGPPYDVQGLLLCGQNTNRDAP